ncbi:YcfL family protein [Campylobacter jejuni]|nr:YcfL family protein [Campylobacter jejuni]
MKKWLLLIIVMLFSACTSYKADTSASNNVIINSNLPKSLIKQFNKRINNNSYLEFEVILYSTFSKDIMYKVDWLDSNGFVLRDVLNEEYQYLRIPAKQEVIIHKISADLRAKDFRIDIKTKN